MQTNFEDKNREREEQEENLKATAKMNSNHKHQDDVYRERQNDLTQTENTFEDGNALTNNNDHPESTDSISLEEKNKRRMDNQQDADFGNEQLES